VYIFAATSLKYIMPKQQCCSLATQVHRNAMRLQMYRERQGNPVQLSEFTATMPLQPTSPDSPIASMSEITTAQQHTPCLNSELTTAVLSTSDISAGDSLQPQQHTAGLGTAGSDFSVLSMSGS